MISFIIPAYNEERLLGCTLAAIKDAAVAAGEPFELLVVDDDSTDRTADIARRHGARVVPVRHRQIAATRNSGGRAAGGDLLVFVDADTIVDEAVVRATSEAMRGGAVGGGCGFRFDGHLSVPTRVVLSVVAAIYRVARLASGCYLFCTREAFEAVGGFDERLYLAEEFAMSRSLKRRGRFVVLREPVTTSARKLRTFTGHGVLTALGRLALKGPGGLRDRRGMELWYGERRDEPGAASQGEGPPARPAPK